MNLAAIALFSAFLSGFNSNFQTVKTGIEANYSNTTAVNKIVSITQYSYDSNSLYADAGFRIASKEVDLTAGFSLYPFQFKHFKAGVCSKVHYRNETDLYNQIDFIAGADFVIAPVYWLQIKPQLGYFLCGSEIIPLRDYGKQWYYNNSTFAALNLYFLPADFIRLNLAIEGSEYFYYRLFGSASFSFGADFYSPHGIVIGTKVSSRWIDLITFAGNYDGTDIKIYAGYRW